MNNSILEMIRRCKAAGKKAAESCTAFLDRICRQLPVRSGEKKSGKKNPFLQAYVASLVSLMLCVTMFLSTTYAWFTASVTTSGNKMYVGTLGVELEHASFRGGKVGETQQVTEDYKILNEDIKWEPGYTAVEKFTVTETGDLAFTYKMLINRMVENPASTEEQIERENGLAEIARNVTVWHYTGEDAAALETLTASFADMVADKQWEKVGTLERVMLEGLAVFSGRVDVKSASAEKAVSRTHIIALHMEGHFDGEGLGVTAQDRTLNDLTISLVANQLTSETDAFGGGYDASPTDIRLVHPVELKDANKLKAQVVMDIADQPYAVTGVKLTIDEDTTMVPDTENAVFTVKTADGANVAMAGRQILPLELALQGLAADQGKKIHVELTIPSNLENVELYHNGTALASRYEASTGRLTFDVTAFGHLDIVYGALEVDNINALKDALENGRSVRLIQNMILDGDTITIPNGAKVTLNFNGYAIEGVKGQSNETAVFTVAAGGELTLKGSGALTADYTLLRNLGTLNIRGGTYDVSGGAEDLILNGGTQDLAKLNVYGGTFKADGKTTFIRNAQGSAIAIHGGSFDEQVVYDDNANGRTKVSVKDGVSIRPYIN